MRLVESLRAAVAAAQSQPTFQAQVEAFVARARELAANGLTWAEFMQLAIALVQIAVAAAMQLANSGADKKALVRSAVGYLFDAVAPRLTLPFPLSLLDGLVRPWIQPRLRALVLTLADGAIEAVYTRLKSSPSQVKPFPTIDSSPQT
jgi:hypothetical protein